MFTMRRAVGAFALGLTVAAGAAALTAPAAAAATTGPVKPAGYWDLIRWYPGTTQGGIDCNNAGKQYGGSYRCDLATIGGVRVYELYIWRE
ncbi:hypothetical protein [Nonomuraea diastatica]|uniref:Chitinase n=1 Tax=Nonomuraea diastatica TaxID=1848329 RepID=A0A4R4WTN9_9ACTN|nr:hypothetical protein [Nonomuraea diastatica]TDD21033.1 hypothetical protein E1294_15865 [Nonomuraea diastatica]